ncbi:MAG: hypothetical protein RL026_623 [Pseudomonadota bacterium]|jgi:lactoylglutathione lyase/glyoxylase I family protein
MNNHGTFADWRVHHVALRVPDYAAAIEWYTTRLGMHVVAEWPFGDLQLAFLALPGNDAFCLELFGGGAVPPVEVRPWTDIVDSLKYRGFHHVCFHVDDVEATVQQLRALGVAITLEPTVVEAIACRIAFFTDPWGNFVELAQRLPGGAS